MATTAAGNSAWYKAKVKVVPSGDCIVVVSVAANARPGVLPEKSITLSSLIAPRLVNLLI
ncbi:nuclease domain-containing protein [Trifolium medium]|uniref:Nuclease domain-containing protein n=1 Tax=Trifolium medium TaxID=97028 RepID=A0A392RPH8_9FABA|nr:nuclease domain-containing protein [Trifolium medium]